MRTPPRLMPAIITPFNPDGAIDLGGHEHNLAAMSARGVAGTVVAGSNGEGPYLEPGERAMLTRVAAEHGFTMVGIAPESLRQAVTVTSEVAAAGADAVLVPTPGTLVRHRPDLIERFFLDLAAVSELPLFLYSVPKVTGIEIPREAVIRLSRHPAIVGIKDSGGDPERCTELASGTDDGFFVFAGASAAVAGGVAGGAHGAITASANYATDLLGEAMAGPGEAHRRLVELARAVESLTVAGVKHAASLTGLRSGPVRGPLRPLQPPERQAVAAAMEEAGLI